MQNTFKQTGWILAALVLVFPALVAADNSLLPDIPLQTNGVFSETQGCVEPTEEMRRNHMEYILHQRDETMHRGIRTKQYSLEECIN
ncbi:MAG: sulfur reduction protein DsrJ, partial [Gammaproteobacteria bacterium]